MAAIAIGSIPTISLAYVKNEITQVDASAGSLTVSNGKGGYATYRTTPATEILLNGVKADLASLAPRETLPASLRRPVLNPPGETTPGSS
jgi:hypothetical protein